MARSTRTDKALGSRASRRLGTIRRAGLALAVLTALVLACQGSPLVPAPTSTPLPTPTPLPTTTRRPTPTAVPPTETPGPMATDCAAHVDPTQQDVQYALAYTGDVFAPEDWQRTYSVDRFRVNVTWLSDDQESLAYLEYLIYPCGYTEDDLDTYFSEENFRTVILRGYQDLQRQAQCALDADELTLHEFTGVVNEREYLIRYWISRDSLTRILVMMLAVPRESQALVDDYAGRLFPALSSCSP